MTDRSQLSRRRFLAAGTVSLGMLAAADSAIAQQGVAPRSPGRAASASAPLRTFTAAEAREFDAITARILPSEPGSPGARELGVVAFADRHLSGKARPLLAPLRSGLAELSRFVGERHPGTSSFAALDAAAQDAILAQCEASDPSKVTNDAERARVEARNALFGVSLRLTTMGAFSDPMYGGNRGKEGWKLLGFDDRHSWVPPFGALDRG